MIYYHGSAAANLKDVGIQPKAGKGGDYWWKMETGKEIRTKRDPNGVFVTNDKDKAAVYAMLAGEANKTKAAYVYSVDVPDSVSLVEDSNDDHGAFVYYGGDIPSDWVVSRKVAVPSQRVLDRLESIKGGVRFQAAIDNLFYR